MSFLILAAAYVLSQFYRTFLAVLAPLLQAEAGLDAAELANLSAVFFGVFAAMQIPVGWALDTYGPRRTVTAGLLLALLGVVAFALGAGYGSMLVAMVLLGAGCSPVLMASFYLFARTYRADRFALLSSAILGIGLVGGLLSATPLAVSVEALGWRTTLLATAGATAVLAVAVFALVRDPPRSERPAHGAATGDLGDFFRALAATWPIMPVAFLSYGVLVSERSLWIGPFLAEVYRMKVVELGNGVLAMAAAMCVGAFAYGPAERLAGSAKPVVLAGTAITGALFLALSRAPEIGAVTAVVLLTAIGLFGLTYSAIISHARQFFPERVLGRGVTFFNLLSMAGASSIQFASGLFIRGSGGGAEGSFGALHLAFGAVLLLAAAVYALSPTRPQVRPAASRPT